MPKVLILYWLQITLKNFCVSKDYVWKIGCMTILKSRIIEKIRQSGGKIPFSEYMQMALYDPKLGYYTGHHHQLGRQGDFITAPELSDLFGKCIVKSLQAVLLSLKNPVIVEYGAGTGKLA